MNGSKPYTEAVGIGDQESVVRGQESGVRSQGSGVSQALILDPGSWPLTPGSWLLTPDPWFGRRALVISYEPYRKERCWGHQVIMPE
jgi:hypothetical protein